MTAFVVARTVFERIESIEPRSRRRMAAAARAAAQRMFDDGFGYPYLGHEARGYSCLALSAAAGESRLSTEDIECLKTAYAYLLDFQGLPFQELLAGERLGRRVLGLLFLAAIVDWPKGAQT